MGELFRTSGGKLYIPPEITDEVQKVGLLDYFKAANPGVLKKVGRDYCFKDHDSMRMSPNGKWNWFSRGIGGVNAISYLMKAEGMSFQEAVIEVMNSCMAGGLNTAASVKTPATEYGGDDETKDRILIMPEKDNNCDAVRRYLMRERGIDANIIDYFINKGTLYQEKAHKSICFVGCDREGIPRIVNVRGIYSKFQSTCTGSDRKYGFELSPGIKTSVHIFEAPIDLLSYAEVIRRSGYDFTKFNFLSLSGIYAPAKDIQNSKKPMCLERYLSDHPETDTIYVHFDNDEAGRNASKAVNYLYGLNLRVIVQHPPEGYKDVNDFIRGKKTMVNESEYERG